MARPNVLCFVTDQQRADHLGCYGNPDVQTPNLDRLAGEGVTFTHAYVANPLCMPNRASLFTGRYPKAHGVRENGIALATSEEVLPELLRTAGYRTASFGKLHLTPYGLERRAPPTEHERYETREYWADHDELPTPYYGFEHVYYVGGHGPYTFGHYRREVGEACHALLGSDRALLPPSGTKESWKAAIPGNDHYNTRIADHTIAFLKEHDPERPFFVWCSFPDPHHPYMPPAPYCHLYDPEALSFAPARCSGELDELPAYMREAAEGRLRVSGLEGGSQMDNAAYREILAHTYGMVTMVDHQIGRVIEALEAQGLLENTVVVFMSDHGDLMGDHWLLNKGPFLFEGLVRVPTIWRLPQRWPRGRRTEALISSVDFMPTVLELADVPVPAGVQGRSYRGVLKGTEGFREAVYLECDETYLHDRLRQLRTREWALTYYLESDQGLLFDLVNDPRELHNLWHNSAYAEVKHRLLLELLRQAARNDSWLPAKKAHA